MEARNKEREEAASDQENPMEGTTSGTDGAKGEGKEEIREKIPAEASNWERVVDLIQTAFWKGRLAKRTRGRRWF